MICNVNTFIINHIFFRLGLTFMNIKAVWMGSASLWEYVCRGAGGRLPALRWERQSGFAGGQRDWVLEGEKRSVKAHVCEAERKLERLGEGQKERRGSM